MRNHFPIVYTFSAKEIKEQKLAGILALFTRSALAKKESARALCNSLQLSLQNEDMAKARCEVPEIRAFAQRLVEECPVLPWVVNLSTPFYREVIYSILPELHVTYQDHKPGKFAATYRIGDMEKIIRSQEKEIARIGKRAGISTGTYRQRAFDVARYLRDGVDLASN